MVFIRMFLLWTIFAGTWAGPPNKGKGKSKAWGLLVQSMMATGTTGGQMEPDQPATPPMADMSDDDLAFSEAAESEDSSPSEIEATAEELDRWDRLGSPSNLNRPTAQAEDVPGRQTRDAAGSTSTQEARGSGYIDPTAGLSPADRRYLQGIPSMASFLRMVESHNWEAIPDAAFTLTCAGLLRECLQDEGHSRDDIHAFAGEMLAQAQQQPPNEPPASSSSPSHRWG